MTTPTPTGDLVDRLPVRLRYATADLPERARAETSGSPLMLFLAAVRRRAVIA
ncbi:hypothetical protein WIS52_31420 [Pseudonocardia nematodicida]|uniref:Uncharacterized protein n=1 Tax=Pseudonocardia nematodicida TaxID=1206997 RepID=A0ABV1KKL1_9PSEU